jgi:hypothetical protein
MAFDGQSACKISSELEFFLRREAYFRFLCIIVNEENIMENDDNKDLGGRSAYFKDIRLFSIIVFMVTLMAAALINTQVEMKQLADVLAFLALGYLGIGIAAQFIRMRKKPPGDSDGDYGHNVKPPKPNN